jgi:putative flippase GtrA
LVTSFLAQAVRRVIPRRTCYGSARGIKEIRRLLFVQMMRFGAVGLINSAVDVGIFFLALATVTSSLVAANIIAWIVAVSSSYVLNNRFTFAEHARPFTVSDYLIFTFTQIGGFAANTGVLLIAAPFLPILAAKILGILAGFLVNFTLARVVVFRTPH